MPNRRPSNGDTTSASFRLRYDALEQRRLALMARLSALGEKATVHPAHRRVRTLLNTTFRNATLVQRAAVLEAAEWLITVLDRATMIL